MKSSYLVFVFTMSMMFIACKDKQATPEDVVSNKTKKTELNTNPTKIMKKTILCFGNSLTAGYGLNEEQAWPNLLQQRLDSLGLLYTVINAGLSGETTSGGLNRIDWVLSQSVDIFILELGANDMLRGIEIQNTIQNLEGILDKVTTKYPKVKILLAGMISPPNMGKSYETAFNNIYPNLSAKYKATLLPFLLEGIPGKDDLILPDGKHPNANGQKVVLENVWNNLEQLL